MQRAPGDPRRVVRTTLGWRRHPAAAWLRRVSCGLRGAWLGPVLARRGAWLGPVVARLYVLSASLGGVLGCGADDLVAPYSAPPPKCPKADAYLEPLYALEEAGKLANLSNAISTRIPDDARRDLVDALLRVASSFQDGDFAALADLPPDDPTRAGIQGTLGKVLRWLSATGPGAPNLPLNGVLRRALGTCEGGPIFALLAEAVDDPELLTALGDLFGRADLGAALAGLDFEGVNGREATAYLVRNLLVAASSDTFEVATVLDLLGLLVDLGEPPYDALDRSLRRLLDDEGIVRLQGLLVCLGRVDDQLVLGGVLYDLLTSGLLAELIPADGSSPPPLPPALRAIGKTLLTALASDADARRALVPAILAFLADDLAPAVLSDVATLLEAKAFDGILELLAELATHRCRLASPAAGGTP